ncbi:MAG: hypothetical protein AAF702_31310 [Chloroflexota bacterium]
MNSFSLLSWLAPSVVIGGLLSIVYASLYHLWGGRTVGDLFLYLVTAAIGFYIGQLLGLFTQVSLFEIGQLRVIEGTIGSWLLLIGVQNLRAYN